MNSIPAIGLLLTAFGFVGGLLALAFKVGQLETTIKKDLKQTVVLASHVPGLWSDVEYIKRHLGLSTPDLPSFINGHDAED